MNLWRIRRKPKVVFVDPNTLFPKYPPYAPLYERNQYNDLTEVGLQSYLQILPSIGLYGFKYAIEINKGHAVLNGDFRTLAAIELGKEEIPVVYVSLVEGRTLIVAIILRKIRKRLNKQSFLYRRFKNPTFEHDNVSLLCKFQQPLFGSVYPMDEIPTQRRRKTPLIRKITNVIRWYSGRKMI